MLNDALESEIVGLLWDNPSLFDDVDVESRWFSDFQKKNLVDRLRLQKGVEKYSPKDVEFQRELLNHTGPYPHLSAVLDWQCAAPPSASAPHYLNTLRQRWLARESTQLALLAVERIKEGEDPASVMGEATDAITRLGEGARQGLLSMASVSLQVALEIEQRRQGLQLPAIPTGFEDLDDLITGFRPGKVYILAARTSVGKTALGMQFADSLSEAGPVLVFSLEMSATDLAERRLASVTGVDAKRVATGEVNDKEQDSFYRESDRLHDKPYDIVQERLGIADMDAHIRRFTRRHGQPVAVMVDYLQLITGPQRDRREVVAEASRQLKAMSKVHNCAFLVLAQVNREAADSPQAPELHHLGESGSIENDADVVMMLHRKKNPLRPGPDDAELAIRKNRGGPLGSVFMQFDGRRARFLPASNKL